MLRQSEEINSYAGVAQLVEHQLPKLRVASSNLVSRSISEAHINEGSSARAELRDREKNTRGTLLMRLREVKRLHKRTAARS